MGIGRAPEVIYEVVEGRAMLVSPAGAEVITLSSVGTLIWEALDGSQDLEGLTNQLSAKFEEVDRAELKADVVEFLGELSLNPPSADREGCKIS